MIDLRYTGAAMLFFCAACGASSEAPGSTSAGSPASGSAGTTGTSILSGGANVPSAGTGANASSAGMTVASGGSSAANGGTTGGVAGSGTAGASVSTAGQSAAGSGAVSTTHFSFFVTSYAALQRLSGSANGFGGDLRFGKQDGLSGADEMCRQIAETSLPGAGTKTWRAFLSVTKGTDGKPVNAIDRIGAGPWYDRLGRLLAMNLTAIAQTRPSGGDSAIINDFPNEDGVPNHAPDGSKQVDNHDMLTGSNATGKVFSSDWSVTCHDWTSAVGSDGMPRVGHSWPRMMGGGPGGMTGGGASSMDNWMSALTEAGCAPGASLVEMGGPIASNPTVGSGGGYGGFYCFALTP